MKRELRPSRKFGGRIVVPGDKSIAHRAALFSILADGPVRITNFPSAKDCRSSLEAARQFGVDIKETEAGLVLTPPDNISLPEDTIIDCGNSGTTARLLSGIAAGSDLEVTLSGDESLSRRPMKRIIDPLTEMGAEMFADGGRLPMKIRGRKLLPFEYRLPVPSAQVKSALLLAGTASGSSVTIREDSITRDHSELMIAEMGGNLTVRKVTPVITADPNDPRKKIRTMPEDFKKEIKLSAQSHLQGGEINIPGDISTGAFFMIAAAISGQTITIQNIGLNPTRTAIIDYLKQVGCTVEISDRETISGEPRGTVSVTGGKLKSRKISGATTVALIDEIPIIAVLAAFAEGTTVIRDAGELRVKESDRLEACATNLKAMGIKCGLLDDGLAIEGGTELSGADFLTYGDHRIAMAFSIASLFLIGNSTIDDDSVVDISCPEFFQLLDQVRQ